jgi:Flp pilus assembly protein TadG
MNDRKGQVLVEFALILPLLLLLTLGMIDYGRLAFATNCLGNAAAVAARIAAVTPSISAVSADLPAASASSQSTSAPATAASNSLYPPTIEPALVTYQQTVLYPAGNPVAGTAHQGDLVQVRLTYNFPMIIPWDSFLAQLPDSPPQGSSFHQIVAQAAVRYE